MTTFKLEYRTANTGWETWQICNSPINLTTEANKLRNQGFEVRCINSIGKNIL